MTPYSRGYAAALKAAAEVCTTIATDGSLTSGMEALPAVYCAERILSLPIEGEATNPGEHVPDSARVAQPTEKEIATYRDTFRRELDKRMDAKHPSASPSTEAHEIALRQFVENRNAAARSGPCVVVPVEELRSSSTSSAKPTGLIREQGMPRTDSITPCSPPQRRNTMHTVDLPKLNTGEIYVGLATDPEGKSAHHVVLLPGDVEKNWHDAKAWAASIGGELPTRTEALLLFHTQRDAFKRDAYWLDSQRADDPSFAWCQNFGWGSQSGGVLSWEPRARAVRRVLVGEE